jgi:hypothetical protein
VVRIRDPERKSSRIRIPDPWGKNAPDAGSGSATLLTERMGIRTRRRR